MDTIKSEECLCVCSYAALNLWCDQSAFQSRKWQLGQQSCVFAEDGDLWAVWGSFIPLWPSAKPGAAWQGGESDRIPHSSDVVTQPAFPGIKPSQLSKCIFINPMCINIWSDAQRISYLISITRCERNWGSNINFHFHYSAYLPPGPLSYSFQ